MLVGKDLGDFSMPTGMAVDSGGRCDNKHGRLYTIEYGNHRIQIFQKTAPYKFIKSFGVYVFVLATRAMLPSFTPSPLAVHVL